MKIHLFVLQPYTRHCLSIEEYDITFAEVKAMGVLLVVIFSVRNDDNLRKISCMIQFRMQLDPSFCFAKLRPIIQRDAQINNGGINTVKIVLKPKAVCRDCG
jgi:hypothetical protein